MDKQFPHILITNDDGIEAPGIKHLWNAISNFSYTNIVAPSKEQSASSLAITLRTPLRLEPFKWENGGSAWHVSGTPADCVKLALNIVFETPPNLIVSGINRGTNAGRNFLYSGTVAAIIEGVLHGIPGIAFSSTDYDHPNYQVLEPYIWPIVEYLLKNPLPKGTFLNVNFPSKFLPIKGFRMARQGLSYFAENPDKRDHPSEGHSYYWLGSKIASFEEHNESDITLLDQGYITAVPIHIEELTHYQQFESRKKHFEAIKKL